MDAAAALFVDLVTGIRGLADRRGGSLQRPLIGLVMAAEDAGKVPPLLVHGLGSAGRRQVPHVAVAVAEQAEGRVAETEDLRALLASAADRFATGSFGRGLRMRFPRFWLLDFIMKQELTIGTPERKAEIVRLVRANSRFFAGIPQLSGGEVTVTPTWSSLPLAITASVMPSVLFRWLVAWRLPGTGSVLRWMMRRKYASQQVADVWSLAAALTRGGHLHESEEARRLLVHAFLRDLRDQFRRVPLRVQPWRGTAYPVLTVAGVSASNAGGMLLSLMARVREDQDDPLTVVTIEPSHGNQPSNDDELGTADSYSRTRIRLAEMQAALQRWRLDPNGTGYVVAVPALDHTTAAMVTALVPRRETPRPPWFAHPAAVSLVPVLLAGGLAAVGLRSFVMDCAPLHVGPGRIDVSRDSGECVGYSDHRGQLFGSDPDLRAAQEVIFTENEQVENELATRLNHPVMSLVYFGTLTKPDGDGGDQTFAAEREELQGVALAQRRANTAARTNADSPYLKVLVANGGQNMRAAPLVADKLTALRTSDSTVLGVVGLVESRSTTKTAIEALEGTDLPIVAPTLSADRIGELSSHYLQIAAPNRDQADMVVRYVTQVLEKKKLFNYYTFGPRKAEQAGGDLYVNTLRDDLKSSSQQYNVGYEELFWTGQSLRDVCSDRYTDGVVFFGGRYSEFAEFVQELYLTCSNFHPILIGDDSVNRYLANPANRAGAPPSLKMTYVSKGSLAFCDNLVKATDSARQYFLADIRGMYDRCQIDSMEPVGERVGLAYDAVLLLVRTTQDLVEGKSSKTAPSPLAVYDRIRNATEPYIGVTGPLTFGQDGVAKNKHLALLCVADIPGAFKPNSPVLERVFETGNRHQTDEAATKQPCA
ncbi:hypothetical protein AB0425_25775 [Actinosynnema sp. NPDC051121]